MGEEIKQVDFQKEELAEFSKRLRAETLELKKLFDQRAFEYSETPTFGLEVEAWLVDENEIPNPINKQFLNLCGHKDIVEEISQFNFELNADPQPLASGSFVALHKNIARLWKTCETRATELASKAVLVGIHPMVRDEMLQPQFLSEGGRYEALNKQILEMRGNQPIKMDIKGKDHFQLTLEHILIESASTSIQVHLKCNQEDFKRQYNASQIATAPCLAVAANSPFLYGNDLWSETRIAVFEQSIALKQFRNKKGENVGRVTFGTGYIRRSALEMFIENKEAYPPLLPVLFEDDPKNLHHLRFHNGTLWRWNRPIIGFNKKGEPHLRIEQRAMASGPSLIDVVANTAFSLGLTLAFANQQKAPEESMTFTDCTYNFYQAAQKGLGATLRWFGKERRVDELILNELLPKAHAQLLKMGFEANELDHYLKDVIAPRVKTGRNGSFWQRAFIETHGADFQSMAHEYLENQRSGRPVHLWNV
jgi:gamma-glutamyl:cysteine ligase YbdK (ATP-grasp superfamily)